MTDWIALIKKKIIYQLEKYIDQYDRLLIFDSDRIQDKNMVNEFIEYIKQVSTKKKYLLMVNGIDLSVNLSEECFVDIVSLKQEELDVIIELYRTYEFSDRITMVAEENTFPSILNYLHTGLLSIQECFDALLR